MYAQTRKHTQEINGTHDKKLLYCEMIPPLNVRPWRVAVMCELNQRPFVCAFCVLIDMQMWSQIIVVPFFKIHTLLTFTHRTIENKKLFISTVPILQLLQIVNSRNTSAKGLIATLWPPSSYFSVHRFILYGILWLYNILLQLQLR